MTVIFYGISNCDQVRKTQAWLREAQVPFRFHDYRRDGLSPDTLARWCRHLPWSALLSKRGQTWRALTDSERARVVDQASAIELMLANPTLIRRPVIEIGEHLLIGFSAERITEALRASGLQPGPDASDQAAPAR